MNVYEDEEEEDEEIKGKSLPSLNFITLKCVKWHDIWFEFPKLTEEMVTFMTHSPLSGIQRWKSFMRKKIIYIHVSYFRHWTLTQLHVNCSTTTTGQSDRRQKVKTSLKPLMADNDHNLWNWSK